MEEKMTFKVIDEKGKEIECEGLFSFESEETGKSYLVYTDYSETDEGDTKVYAAIYYPDKKEGVLQPIETDAEFEIVQEMLEQVQSKNESSQEGDEQ